ncbi:MAG: DNA methyltransferase [Candidatus Pacearchaeota archaeon]
MSNINENKFYQALESIFTGANIEGESGYVNLLKIKSSYYNKILEQFQKDVDNEPILTDSFKEEFFDKLYSFFEKYFSESGSVYFAKTANWQRVYEQVYTDNKDVVLFWKTHMLYYVKSDVLFQSIDVNITDKESKQDYNFYFDVGDLQAKQNNEKKELVFTFREVKEEKNNVDVINEQEGKKTFVFDVAYKEGNKKTKIDDITKQTKIPEHVLEKAFKTFKKQPEVDFFINKNAEKFLTEQLDMYLHQTLLNEENKFEQKRLNQIKTIKTFALKIIKFIAQFEDELVRVWNKPKFALNSNYVITIDKLTDEIIEKIAKHKNLPEQIKEWQELGMVDEDFDFSDLNNNDLLKTKNEKYRFLPIDTKFFKDLELEILSLFDNLDEALDGRLIHSENYQALNTLQEKYKEKVQCVYIDPPFNTGSDFAYIDKFQDSTWLSLMNDRIELSRKFLRDDGSFYLHLDRKANYLGRFLLQSHFVFFRNEIIWKYFVSGKYPNEFAKDHDVIMVYSNRERNLYNYRKVKDEVLYEQKKSKGELIVGNDGNEYYKYNGELRTFNKQLTETWNINKVKRDGNEILGFDTQKPEKLLERILKASSNENTLILDFFTGSATTIATAHKLNRKWLGVEMGDHFNNFYLEDVELKDSEKNRKQIHKQYCVIDIETKNNKILAKVKKVGALGRLKEVLAQNGRHEPCGISKELEKNNKLKKGGFFKYYSLEQYEDTLRNMKYKDSSPNSIFDERKKFAHVLDAGKDTLDIDFNKLYPNIDFAETISNLQGLSIKKITKTSVILQDGEEEKEIKTDYKNMNESEKLGFIRLLKSVLWWGE